MLFLSSANFFSKLTFLKKTFKNTFVCQMVWIQIKTYVLSGSKPFAKLVDNMSPLGRKELINQSEDFGKATFSFRLQRGNLIAPFFILLQ